MILYANKKKYCKQLLQSGITLLKLRATVSHCFKNKKIVTDQCSMIIFYVVHNKLYNYRLKKCWFWILSRWFQSYKKTKFKIRQMTIKYEINTNFNQRLK